MQNLIFVIVGFLAQAHAAAVCPVPPKSQKLTCLSVSSDGLDRKDKVIVYREEKDPKNFRIWWNLLHYQGAYQVQPPIKVSAAKAAKADASQVSQPAVCRYRADKKAELFVRFRSKNKRKVSKERIVRFWKNYQPNEYRFEILDYVSKDHTRKQVRKTVAQCFAVN